MYGTQLQKPEQSTKSREKGKSVSSILHCIISPRPDHPQGSTSRMPFSAATMSMSASAASVAGARLHHTRARAPHDSTRGLPGSRVSSIRRMPSPIKQTDCAISRPRMPEILFPMSEAMPPEERANNGPIAQRAGPPAATPHHCNFDSRWSASGPGNEPRRCAGMGDWRHPSPCEA